MMALLSTMPCVRSSAMDGHQFDDLLRAALTSRRSVLGTCVLTVKPPVKPACANGMIDGSETDTDCGGGTCPRCVNGKHCVRRADCASAFCSTFGACVACATDAECRATGGQCFCAAPPDGGPKTCYASAPAPGTAGCVACPPGTVCQFANTPNAGCFELCNAL